MTEILRSAQLSNIKTMDIQHCIISPYNIIYNYDLKEKHIYYEDFLITWGKAWEDNCSIKSKII
mgnify:CR=1 FL=1